MFSAILLLISSLVALTPLVLATSLAPVLTCDPIYPAPISSLAPCISSIAAHSTDTITLSGPALTQLNDICPPTLLETSNITIVLTRVVSDISRTTKGDIACGLQRIMDKCAKDGRAGGTGPVCGSDEFAVAIWSGV